MTNLADLEKAVGYKAQLAGVQAFLKGLDGRGGFGPVRLTFGSYTVEVSSASVVVRESMMRTLREQETIYRRELMFLGVELED